MVKFNQDIYTLMLDNWEMWFVSKSGSAMIIADCSLMDC
jgi:hypothetical protein